MAKRYRIFIPEKGKEKAKEMVGKVLDEVIIDEDTQSQFEAKVIISESPGEGYDELLIQERGGYVEGHWYIRIVEIEEMEEEMTVFESMKLGDRRGYMLRSMMAEEKDTVKKEIMTKDLQKRWKQKKELVDKLLGKGEQDKR
jgi:hypothetical protein